MWKLYIIHMPVDHDAIVYGRYNRMRLHWFVRIACATGPSQIRINHAKTLTLEFVLAASKATSFKFVW